MCEDGDEEDEEEDGSDGDDVACDAAVADAYVGCITVVVA